MFYLIFLVILWTINWDVFASTSRINEDQPFIKPWIRRQDVTASSFVWIGHEEVGKRDLVFSHPLQPSSSASEHGIGVEDKEREEGDDGVKSPVGGVHDRLRQSFPLSLHPLPS